jgi:hypothetical protein
MFALNFALSGVPSQNPTFAQLQTVDQNLAVLANTLSNDVDYLTAHGDLTSALNMLRDIENSNSANFQAMYNYIADLQNGQTTPTEA